MSAGTYPCAEGFPSASVLVLCMGRAALWWAVGSDNAEPRLRDQAGRQGDPHALEWPTPVDMPEEKMLLKPLRF